MPYASALAVESRYCGLHAFDAPEIVPPLLAKRFCKSIQTLSEKSVSVNKRLFVGVDEAGYGPNLGPLLIGGSAWLAPQEMTETTFCTALNAAFKAEVWRANCPHVPLGDSKKLYQSGGRVTTLEAGLLALLAQTRATLPSSLLALVETTACILTDNGPPLPWYRLDTLAKNCVPSSVGLFAAMQTNIDSPSLTGTSQTASEIERLAAIAKTALAQHEIELVDIQAVIVTEPYFNHHVTKSGSKGQLLSETTLQLVADILGKHPGLPAEVFCDRQGGRKNYLPVLLAAMPNVWFTETMSNQRRCSYRSQAEVPCDIHFTVGGDNFPPTALASMLAKYLRERLMECFNQFWQSQAQALRPTAGYPVDAKRFRAEIEKAAALLDLEPKLWWRCK